MNLVRVTEKEFDKFYELLQNDFCFEERKTKQDQFKALSNKTFNPCFIYDDNKLLGYFCYWEYDKFMFCEHFAILKEMRGSGCGTKFLKWFLSNFTKPLILEVELPNDDISIRRIKFYQNLGFVLNDHKYLQPSYHNDNNLLPMNIMSYKTTLTKQEFDDFVNIVTSTAYNTN